MLCTSCFIVNNFQGNHGFPRRGRLCALCFSLFHRATSRWATEVLVVQHQLSLEKHLVAVLTWHLNGIDALGIVVLENRISGQNNIVRQKITFAYLFPVGVNNEDL